MSGVRNCAGGLSELDILKSTFSHFVGFVHIQRQFGLIAADSQLLKLISVHRLVTVAEKLGDVTLWFELYFLTSL